MQSRELCKRAQLHQQTNKHSPHHNAKINKHSPITTQKETSPSTPETNVLPNAKQSYPLPPAITTGSFDHWKLIDQKLENKKNHIYKNVVNWKPRFIILSKNKPGFQFIELLNQQLLSLVEKTSNESSNDSPESAAPQN